MTDFDNRFLDHFTYDAREDDGYGPDHPRLGDKGWLARLSGLGAVLHVKDFEVAYGRLGLPFAVIRLDRLIASRLGESLKNMGQLFDGLQHTPMVTLLDEADALLAQRGVGQDVAEMRRVTNLILQRLDQWDVRGVLVCATNLTAMLDPAALRRFDLRLDMPVADEQTAIAIIQSRLVELAMSVDDIAAMAACAAGLAPALIVQAVDTAARRTLLESDITMIDGGLLTGLMEQARVDTGEERRASDA